MIVGVVHIQWTIISLGSICTSNRNWTWICRMSVRNAQLKHRWTWKQRNSWSPDVARIWTWPSRTQPKYHWIETISKNFIVWQMDSSLAHQGQMCIVGFKEFKWTLAHYRKFYIQSNKLKTDCYHSSYRIIPMPDGPQHRQSRLHCTHILFWQNMAHTVKTQQKLHKLNFQHIKIKY